MSYWRRLGELPLLAHRPPGQRTRRGGREQRGGAGARLHGERRARHTAGFNSEVHPWNSFEQKKAVEQEMRINSIKQTLKGTLNAQKP